MAKTILVTGATGNTGRHVVDGLLAEGCRVRALSRDPTRAGLPAGVVVLPGDVTRAEDVARAAEGTHAVYLVWPGTDTYAAGGDAAVRALAGHVQRVVYLSAVDAGRGGVWAAMEHAIRRHVDAWTFLRVSGLATNALAWADQVHRGVVRAPFGRMQRSLVHERDVAAVAVRALLDPGHAGHCHVVTGPEAISQARQVETIAGALGVVARWEEQPLDEARRELAAEVGGDFADLLLSSWRERADTPEIVSGDVERILGRPALTFGDWARDHRADFEPAPASVAVGADAR